MNRTLLDPSIRMCNASGPAPGSRTAQILRSRSFRPFLMYLMYLQAAGYPADEAASPDALDFRASYGRLLQAWLPVCCINDIVQTVIM